MHAPMKYVEKGLAVTANGLWHVFNTANQREAAGVDFFCDASVLAQAGTPSIVFGPGDIAQAHTADEWIATASLERGTRILSQFLQALP